MSNNQKLQTVLIGASTLGIHELSNFRLINDLDYSDAWSSRPYTLNTSVEYSPSGFPRLQTTVGVGALETITASLAQGGYASKAAMSLDGLISPISFYPTPHASTFHITKYPTIGCPFCAGTQNFTYSTPNDNLAINFNMGIGQIYDQITTKTMKCPFCENVSSKVERSQKSARSTQLTPPYILASGSDFQITSNPQAAAGRTPVINYATLNPVVLNSGEFSNFQNRQSGDYTGHSINLVSFGLMPPAGADSISPLGSKNIDRNYSDYDANFVQWRNDTVSMGVTVAPVPNFANNMRFFGLRGPLMLHSWGYDLEGFPVPNASGEPLVQNGQVVRDGNNNIVGKNQTRKSDGSWSKPYKENSFYKGWAQSPGCWPVGPIDLRWDDTAGVWTVGANYKPVYVVIEEDLVNQQPIRGQLLQSNFANDPLPSGLRRLIYVKRQSHSYSAPRGAQLYCRYNPDNGFYEPVGFPQFITSGVVISQNTVNVFGVYQKPDDNELQPEERPDLERYETTYGNPLNMPLSIGSTALFIFLKGQWNLFAFNNA